MQGRGLKQRQNRKEDHETTICDGVVPLCDAWNVPG